ncbi:MAG TPA: hypothetical protein VG817_05275 [Gemmatimonadales bacterium]|nr:hypothetical protein [Gemmatimonadales bacterium]
MTDLIADLRNWAAGRWWWWRALLLLFLAWDGVAHLRDPEEGGIFAGITFGVHEFGHLLFAFGGETLAILGGSLNQVLIPIGAGALMFYYRDYFGIAVAGTWLSSSLMDMARYVADSRVFELDLVGFGEDVGHDWAYLLGHWGLLSHDLQIAGGLRFAALLLLLGSLGFGGWVCSLMWRPRTG